MNDPLQSSHPVLYVLGIILAMGMFGGVVNFFLTVKQDRSWPKSLTAGVAASILVPLFLRTISSDLLNSKERMTPVSLMVFAGFCLLCSVFSTRFMQSLSERILKDVQRAQEKVTALEQKTQQQVTDLKHQAEEVKQQTEKTVQTAVDEIFSETEPEASETARPEFLRAVTPDLTEPEMKVLQALLDSRFPMRTFSGIAMDTKISAAEVESLLEDLQKRGLAQILQRPKGLRAVITAQGKAALPK